MITSCRSLLGTRLSSPCAIDFVVRPGRIVQVMFRHLDEQYSPCCGHSL